MSMFASPGRIVLLAAALLTGCAGASFARVPATQRSWFAANAQYADLLYVSDYETNDVDIYSYPQGKRVGVLAGILQDFVYPSGLCADASGDVFVPNSADSTVLEFAHGGTRPIARLADPNEYPYSCAVDAASHDLAVVNLESLHGSGSIAIYTRARGQPAIYTYPYVYKYFFAAYDSAGDLFADSTYDAPSAPFVFLELPKGKKAMRGVTLRQAFHIPAGVAWDGRYVVVGDSKSSALYRFAIHGSIGKEISSSKLSGARYLTQFFVAKRSVVAANFHGRTLGFWKYPAGGTAQTLLRGFGEPFGVTLSEAPR